MLEKKSGTIQFLGLQVQYLTYSQMGMEVNGFRFGDLAYISDIRNFDDTIYTELAGVNTLIISALRHAPSFAHFNVEEAINFSQKIGANKTWFTHISHELDHETTNQKLPPNIRLGYDGLELDFTITT